MAQIKPRTPMPRALGALALALLVVGPIAVAWFALGTEPRERAVARLAFADGRYQDCGTAVAEWLRAAPNAPEAHLLNGRVAVAMGRLPEAATALARAKNLGLPRDQLALLHALIASKAGRHAEAEPTLRQAFAATSVPDRQIDEALTKAYLETYDLTRATEVLDRWARDFPDDPKPYLWRADVHGRTASDPAAVENDFRQALLRDGSLARARLGLAEELRKAHRNAEAAREYEAYLTVAPDDAAAHVGAGRNLMEFGNEEAAAPHLNRAMELDSTNAEPLCELSAAASRRGDWTAALAFLDRAIDLAPFDVAVRHSRGLALAHLGRAEEARAEQNAATRLRKEVDRMHEARARLIVSPHDRQSQLEIARWMFDHAHDQEGARWAERILAERPHDPDASGMLANYHERRGETGIANFYRVHAPIRPGPAGAANEIERP